MKLQEKQDRGGKKTASKDVGPKEKEASKGSKPVSKGEIPAFASKGSDKQPTKKEDPTPKEKKTQGPEIKDKVEVDFEPEITNEELEYIFEGDFSDIDEHLDILEETRSQLYLLSEAISIKTRLHRRAVMRRSRQKVQLGRRRALRRRATYSKIQKRARRTAINRMKRRFAGNKPASTLSYSEKARVERLVRQRKSAVSRVTRRLIRPTRELERARLNRRR